ncbi:putative phage abortive infection protein [Sodalis sp. RH22]|uniref:putative phage abortive infection protein n=1 Tax=unclassified Sodalis (in: enterobacteria) TaxID=2636512 RepID=UPI0039B6BF37
MREETPNDYKGLKLIIIFSILTLVICIMYFYASYFLAWPFSEYTREGLGQFGDSWGAITSLFSALAFLGVLFTIRMQSVANTKSEKANSEQTNFLTLQKFESNFFQMLNFLGSIIGDMDIRTTDSEKTAFTGRDAFYFFYMKNLFVNRSFGSDSSVTNISLELLHLKKEFSKLYEKRQQDLGHYFRFLYNIFRYIDNASITETDKINYSKILRAQLSNYELLIIFYNCLTELGNPFVKIAIKHQLFDNLPIYSLMSVNHKYFIKKEAFGKQGEDFIDDIDEKFKSFQCNQTS